MAKPDPAAPSGGGVIHDDTLVGNGTSGSPLGVAGIVVDASGNMTILKSLIATAGPNNRFMGQLVASHAPPIGSPPAPSFIQGGGWSFQGAGAYPALPSTPVHNYAPPGFGQNSNLIKQPTHPDGSTLTGLVQTLYQRLTILNLGPGPLTLPHNDPGSILINRWFVPGGGPLVLAVGETVTWWGQGDLGPGWIILR